MSLISTIQKFHVGHFSYDGISNLSSMETYNIEEDKWTLATSMVAHEGGVGIGVIPFHPSKIS